MNLFAIEMVLVSASIMGMVAICYGGNYGKSKNKFLDMTYILDNQIPIPPLFEPLKRTVNYLGAFKSKRITLDWLADFSFQMAEHMGTHLDAPFHLNQCGRKLEDIPFQRLHGPAVKIDISKRANTNSEATVEVRDICEWEHRNGRIPYGAFILMYSGWGKFWNNATHYLGGNTVDTLHHPGFSKEAAAWLIRNRPYISGLGVDTTGCDSGQNSPAVYKLLVKNDLLCVANTANMDQLPENGAELFVMPIIIRGGSGGPARVFAVWDEPHHHYNSFY